MLTYIIPAPVYILTETRISVNTHIFKRISNFNCDKENKNIFHQRKETANTPIFALKYCYFAPNMVLLNIITN